MLLCDVKYFFSAGMDWYLNQFENLLSSSRPSQMVLSRFWISIASINDELEAMDQ